MSKLDIRTDSREEISAIVFAEPESERGTTQASKVERHADDYQGVLITDSDFDLNDQVAGFVVVSTALDASNLIKALEKAIDLGWFK